ncbi:MAG: LPS export ABC transporter ATP-binding protein [Pseudomonadota bacterium]
MAAAHKWTERANKAIERLRARLFELPFFAPRDPVERLGRIFDAEILKAQSSAVPPVNVASPPISAPQLQPVDEPVDDVAIVPPTPAEARVSDAVVPPPDVADDTLEVVGLRKAYRGRAVVIDAALKVRRGEAVGLLGPNGAGKTTIFYMITGLVSPDAGSIHLDGKDVTHLPMYQRARLGIGYLPQEASIFRGLTVAGNIRAVLELVEPNPDAQNAELEALMQEFRIEHLRDTPSIALSGGERRRCEIARALASRPAFMLLDEPFAGVDPIAVGDIRDLVRHLTQRDIGVLITDHNVRETLSLIDRATIIHSGKVLTEGSSEDIVNSSDARRLYLGEDFTL